MTRLGRHTLTHGDSREKVDYSRYGCVVFDPPWNEKEIEFPPPPTQDQSLLAFTDGQFSGNVISRYGAPAWIFVWYCESCFVITNRPFKSCKMCFWYGDVRRYQWRGSRYIDLLRPRFPKVVKNKSGPKLMTPNPAGRRLGDVFCRGISHVVRESGGHPHAKPLDWVRCLIANTSEGDIVDPFCGSGTTILAAEQLGRVCHAYEVEGKWVEVAARRYEALSC